MSGKSVVEKARVKPGTTFAVRDRRHPAVRAMHLPESMQFVDANVASIVCVVVETRADLEKELSPAVQALAEGAHLWACFRKGSRAAGHGVNRDDVWAAADAQGLRPIGLISIDDTWSVFRLRR